MDLEMNRATRQHVVYHRVLRLLSYVMAALDLDVGQLPLWEDVTEKGIAFSGRLGVFYRIIKSESLPVLVLLLLPFPTHPLASTDEEQPSEAHGHSDSENDEPKKPLPTTISRFWEKCKVQSEWLKTQVTYFDYYCVRQLGRVPRLIPCILANH